MIETTRQNYKTIAVLISTLGGGLPLWTRAPRQVDFTDISFLSVWLLIGIGTSVVSLLFINLKMRDMVGSFTIGYVVAVVTMFVSSILISNYVHGQLTLALPVAMGIGALSGAAGSLTWKWIKRS
ncbi:MAG: hypothetical protein WD315_02285 [Balneolaceae bacterium]